MTGCPRMHMLCYHTYNELTSNLALKFIGEKNLHRRIIPDILHA